MYQVLRDKNADSVTFGCDAKTMLKITGLMRKTAPVDTSTLNIRVSVSGDPDHIDVWMNAVNTYLVTEGISVELRVELIDFPVLLNIAQNCGCEATLDNVLSNTPIFVFKITSNLQEQKVRKNLDDAGLSSHIV